ncbi:TetR family transcriptional regulator [Geodermatophilus aquaeductus]|uniref:Transcriptional regulator, TetR family n=1 Tax=Geodermatophilus aquaeductus TaxID=1564161 RepID=A0A521CZ77_9ACTN|nr:TetR/AcrR family transcriptional regulator [Geodermatophilus aquaeductus]SMO64735.1 transcriptional regulator, TetR family [Geodermatophilus aquaeductus]
MSEGKRVYRSDLRQEQARRTRVQVLDAATRCFVERGYAATTMREIAAAAGVSVPTVFAQGGKAALLLACVDRALVGSDEDRPVRELGPFAELLTAADRPARLAALHRLASESAAGTLEMQDVFAAAAAADPEVAAPYAAYERRRRADVTLLVRAFADDLRADLDLESAVDVVWSVLSPQTQSRLIRGCGWPPQRYADWLPGAVERLLLR